MTDRMNELLSQPEPATEAEFIAAIDAMLAEFNAMFAQDEQERAERKRKEDEERPILLEKKLEELGAAMRQAMFDIQRLQDEVKFFREMAKRDDELTELKALNATLTEINKLQAQINAQEKRIRALETSAP